MIRSAVVLSRAGGALETMLLPFKLYLGGPPGSGEQWFSWIHIEDEVAAIRFLLEDEKLSGAFNLAAPSPLRMREFCNALGEVLNRPSRLAAPPFMLRLLFGEMADEMLLQGQCMSPSRLTEAGFAFKYPDARSALRQILG